MIEALRHAQAGWAETPLAARIAILRRFRKRLVAEAEQIARTAARPAMSEAEIILAELLPLAASCRFVERHAAALLAPRRVRAASRPVWLLGTRLTIERAPLGCVLILAPGNYPLLLAGVQAIQALTAGNAVAIKPAPGWHGLTLRFADLLAQAGLPPDLLLVLGDRHEDGADALAAPFDHAVLTGSAATGRAVLAALAPRLIPATMELSGSDPCIVLASADIAAAAAAIAYGLGLNGGATCIAPRRIVVLRPARAALAEALDRALAAAPARPLPPAQAALVSALVTATDMPILGDPDALEDTAMRPLVLCRRSGPGGSAIPPDLFAPLAFLLEAETEDDAVAIANASPYALGASVFGAAAEAETVAARLRAGCVTVNDMIVPTADPHLPFGGTGASGFGTTRGAEGLLGMTRPRATLLRRRPSRLHFRPLAGNASRHAARILRLLYGW